MTDRRTDQLTLRLDPGLPRLPATLVPMRARVVARPFDSPDHRFEPVWGGLRALALAEAGAVRVLGPDGTPLATPLPELDDLPGRLDARSAALDGELVAVGHDGRPDPDALAARLDGRGSATLAYLVSDLLYLDGRPLLGLALERRLETLGKLLTPGGAVVAVPSIVGDGRALHAAVTAQGLGGVLGRERRSAYLPGTTSRAWRYVAAGDPPLSASDGTADDSEATDTTPDPTPLRPILAVFQRLPLGDD